jgi:hypothetical protein
MNTIESLKVNVQFFSQDDSGGKAGEEITGTEDRSDKMTPSDSNSLFNKPDDIGDDKSINRFTQGQVDQIIKDRVIRLKKDKQKAIDKAKKLAQMNAEKKQDYKIKKLQLENEALKLAQSSHCFGKEATKMLAESGIIATDEVLDFVVREDAETTRKAVKVFSELVDNISSEKMKEKLKDVVSVWFQD